MSTFRAINLPLSCPPSHSKEQTYNNVYRLIKTDCIDEREFMSNLEESPRRKPKNGQNICDLNAISFFTSKNAIMNVKKAIYNFRNTNIAIGNLNTSDGKTTLNNSHINLWIYQNVDLHSRFTMI